MSISFSETANPCPKGIQVKTVKYNAHVRKNKQYFVLSTGSLFYRHMSQNGLQVPNFPMLLKDRGDLNTSHENAVAVFAHFSNIYFACL